MHGLTAARRVLALGCLLSAWGCVEADSESQPCQGNAECPVDFLCSNAAVCVPGSPLELTAVENKVTGDLLPPAVVGQPYDYRFLQLAGGLEPFAWSVQKGEVPWLSINSETGRLVGTPTLTDALANRTLTVSVTDSSINGGTIASLTLRVDVQSSEACGAVGCVGPQVCGFPQACRDAPEKVASDLINDGGAAVADVAELGSAVDVAGAWALVGAPLAESGRGVVVVYNRTASGWGQHAVLRASDPTDAAYFGTSVAMSPTLAVIGSPGKSAGAGAAYVFRLNGGNWTQEQKLGAADAAAGDGFGVAVALDDGTTERVVVGAPFDDGEVETPKVSAGAAYVFTFATVGLTWEPSAQLRSQNGEAGTLFGSSVGISGDRVVVGAPGVNESSARTFVGAASVFNAASNWNREATFESPLPPAPPGLEEVRRGLFFGRSVALVTHGGGESTAVVGAYGEEAAYVFTTAAGVWGDPQKLEIPESEREGGERFGFAVDIADGALVVGAALEESAGAAYIFTASGSVWSFAQRQVALGIDVDDAFGAAVGTDGTQVIIGAPGTKVGSTEGYGNAIVY